MRTTLDIDDDVLQAVKELARRDGTSAGAVVSRLAREALTGTAAPPSRDRKSAIGFRAYPADGRVVTSERIDELRDAEGL